jgi:hypothetical protein
MPRRKTNTYIHKSKTLATTATWLANTFGVQTNPNSGAAGIVKPEDGTLERNCTARMLSWRHACKESHAADCQLSQVLAARLERRLFQPKHENDCINKPGRMVLDEVQTKLIEQVNLVIAMPIRSRWRRLNDTGRRFKHRSVRGRFHRRLEEPTVEQQPIE